MTDAQNVQTEAPRRSASRTIARNTVFGIGGQIALKVLNFAFNVLVVRILGGAEYGQYNIVLAWAGLFSVIGDLGITQYLQREIARDERKTEELFWDTVSLRLILGIACSVITIVGAKLFTTYSDDMILGLFVFTIGYFFQSLIVPLGGILTGNERLDLMSVFGFLQQFFFIVMASVVLLLNLGFVWLLLVGTINLPITLLMYYWAVRRNKMGPPPFRIHPATWWNVLLRGIPFGFQQLSLTFAFRADTVLLRQYNVPDLFVGWYNIAYINLTLFVLSFTTSFNQAVMPTLAKEHVNNPDVVKNWYFRSVKILLFLGLPMAVGGMMLAWKLVDFLYPEELPAALPLMILVWDIPFVMYHAFCGNLTTSIKREGAGAWIYGSLGFVNIVLNLTLIPLFGIIGSSFATVFTDMLGAALFYLLFRREFGFGLGFSRLIRIPVSAALMGVLLYVLRDWHVLVLIPLGGLAYLGLVLLLGVFTAEERSQFSSIFSRIASRLRPQAA